MSVTDDLLENARAYEATFDKGGLPMPPGPTSRSSPVWMHA